LAFLTAVVAAFVKGSAVGPNQQITASSKLAAIEVKADSSWPQWP